MSLNSNQIFGTDDLGKPKEVKIPEWKGSVYVKMMSGEERDAFEFEHVDNERRHFRARLAVYTCCDEDGKLIFSSNDIEKLSKKSASALTRIFSVASKLNKLSDKDINELGND